MKIEKAKTVIQGFTKALKIIERWSTPDIPSYCWFRGVNDNSLSLQPGAVWRENYNEFEAMLSFVQEGASFAQVESVASWDTYYLAQHHGMPTRLLDWTESFCSAMFFALDGVQKGKTPCVWILQPEFLNKHFLKWHGIMAPENRPELDGWLPLGIQNTIVLNDDGYSYDNNNPLAIYAKKSNSRIVAQQGAFTLHGRNRRSLCEMIAEDFEKPQEILTRIDFEGIDLAEARMHLATLGVKRSAIYPDIDNFVRQLGESYWPNKQSAPVVKKKTKSPLTRPTTKKAAKKASFR